MKKIKVEEVLLKCGLSDPESIILGFLLKHKKSTSRNIEHSCRLHQPVDSYTLNKFLSKGWLKREIIPTEKRLGLPEFMYILESPMTIYKYIDKELGEKQKEIEEIRHMLSSLIDKEE